MKKNNLIIFIPIILPLIIGIAIYSTYVRGKKSFSVEKMYEKNWNINIPSDFDIIVHKHTPISFHGDGVKYTVFSTNNETKFFKKFSIKKNKEIENDVTDKIKRLNLSNKDKSYLTFTKTYSLFKIVDKNDWLIIFYYPKEKKCVFVEYIQ